VADALRKEPGLQVEMVDGNRGEFSVLVGNRVVARNQDHDFPPVEKVVEAVRKAEAPAAGAKT
jgi:hypothetical protein